MNKVRMAKIKSVMPSVVFARDAIENALNEEQDYYDNIPENLLESDRACASEEYISILEDVLEELSNAVDNLEEIE